jgi:pimeloyl-ACP methyl ester carboxylesterase
VAYEAARDQVVFFGGYLAPGSHDDTWVWDGSTWAQRLPPASPPARQGHAMAYDPVRAQVVLFGGGANGGPTSGDTWVWSSAGLAPPARPLIFIPGLMGSSLDSDSLIRSNLWPGVVSDHNSLTLDPAKQQTNLIPVEAIGHVTSVVIYDPLLNFLRTTGGYREYLVNGDPARRTTAGCDLGQSSNHPDLFVFAYDWRLSNSENVAKLKDYVGCVQRFYPGTKVDLLTHSMGGLIARRYIITNPADHAVEKLVTIAAPWLGAPKAINVMETGEYDNLNKLIFKSTLRSLAEYFPSAHQLLPSPQYFALGGRPYVKDGTLFRDYDQFATAFNSEFPRSLPATDGKTFHDRPGQDDWRADQSGVTYYHIYGQRPVADTISAVTNTTVTSRGLFGSKTYHVFNTTFTRGDKTVPVLSAERRNAGAGIDLNAPGATLKLFDGPISLGADYYEHTGLTRNPNVLNYIRSILKPSPPAAPPWAESGAPAAASAAAPAYYVRVVGAGSVLVADAASHTTDPLADLSDDGVPDVTTYRAGEKSALVVAPADQAVSITARSDGDPMSVEISKGSDVDTSEAVRYQDLSLPAGVKLQLKFGPSGLESLKYDADGDGTFESTVAPTASASGAAAQDTEPPQLAASQTPHGSSAILTLSATDVGSGVKAIYYSTDGSNFLPYTGALTFAAPGKRVVYAFADDNVANRSQLLTVKVPFPPPKRWGVISPRTKGN